jgi:hypothetical protein
MHEQFAELQADRPDLKIIGWYHTHPNDLGVFMSATDRRTQELYFNKPGDFAIVLNPQRCHSQAFLGPECVLADLYWPVEEAETHAYVPSSPIAEPVLAQDQSSTETDVVKADNGMPVSDVTAMTSWLGERVWIVGRANSGRSLVLAMRSVEKRITGIRSPAEPRDTQIAQLYKARVQRTRLGDKLRIVDRRPRIEAFWVGPGDSVWLKTRPQRWSKSLLVVLRANELPHSLGRMPIASDFVLEVVVGEPDKCRLIDLRPSRPQRGWSFLPKAQRRAPSGRQARQ